MPKLTCDYLEPCPRAAGRKHILDPHGIHLLRAHRHGEEAKQRKGADEEWSTQCELGTVAGRESARLNGRRV